MIPKFLYSNVNFLAENVVYDEINNGCECIGHCDLSCFCMKAFLSKKSINISYHYPIIVCNNQCICSFTCPGRFLSQGPSFHVYLFYEPEKGWGVKTAEIIPSGVFVGEYIGEILSEKERQERQKRYGDDPILFNYLFSIIEYFPFSNQFFRFAIDATRYGSFSRLFNHSCDPNMVAMTVRDHSLCPHIGLFSCREIKMNEELTYSYGPLNDYTIHDGIHNSNPILIPCLCKSQNCRGFLPLSMSL